MKFTKRDEKEKSGGGVFLKFEDGESKTGVFRGEPYEFYQYWDNAKRRGIVVGPDHPEAKTRFRLNFVVYEDNQFVARIFEFPVSVYNQLADLSEGMDIETTKIKIIRKGVGKETEWALIPLFKEQLSKAQLAQIEAVQLAALEHKDAAANGAPKAGEGTFESEMPF